MPALTKVSLFKRSNGIYYVAYAIDGVRRWRSTGCTTKGEALKALTQMQRLLQVRSTSRSLAQFVAEYRPYAAANLRPGTSQGYNSSLVKLKAFLGDVPIAKITRRDVDEFILERRKSVKPVTVNIELRSLRAAFGVACRWGYINTNHFAKVALCRLPEVRPTFLSREDLRRLLGVVREAWLRELILFSVCTGARRGEATTLSWSQVDFGRRVIHIQSNVSFHTKGGKGRTLPMNEAVYRLLQMKQREGSQYVFTREGQRLGASYVTHLFKRYVREIGLEDRLHWHSLRHTFASWLAQDGVSLYAIQKLLGHSSSAVTQIYAHLQPEQLHSVVDRIAVGVN